MCGSLLLAMHGATDAAQHWQGKCSETVGELGFVTCNVAPCHDYRDKRHPCGLVHGDDFALKAIAGRMTG